MSQDESTSGDSDAVVRRQLYDAYFKDARAQQVASQQSYDKAILLYSSGGLAISIAFLKDLVGGVKNAVSLDLLRTSWVLFALAMSATVLSFLVSAASQSEAIENAEDYYINKNDDARNRKSYLDIILLWLNRASGVLFLLGVGATVWFAASNV